MRSTPSVKKAPITAATSPRTNAEVSVVPAISLSFSLFRAPHACPISTVEPDASPMMNEIRRIMIGKNTETAASASTPISCPMKMELMVPDSDCSVLDSIRGMRKSRNRCQSGRWALVM